MQKKCSKCLKEKGILEFSKHSEHELRGQCIDCYRELRRKRYRANPAKAKATALAAYHADPNKKRNSDLKRRFGISLQDYIEMLTHQNDRCAICERNQKEFNLSFSVDHDHKSGKIRGLLCGSCNTALGKFQDSPQILKQAIRYLRK